jgi:hypothetical protein
VFFTHLIALAAPPPTERLGVTITLPFALGLSVTPPATFKSDDEKVYLHIFLVGYNFYGSSGARALHHGMLIENEDLEGRSE